MKKIILPLILIFLHAQLFSLDNNIDLPMYESIIFTLLSDLKTIIDNGNHSDNVYSAFSVTMNAIDKKTLTFSLDPSKDTILGGMSFTHDLNTDKISLSFGQKFLDTYKKEKSIHYTIMMHEMRHVYDYIKDKNAYTSAKDNPGEAYWYELDALHIEAEFIANYLRNYKLSKFEQYALESFERDNLDSLSIVMKKERMDTFFYFNRLKDRYFGNKSERELIINEIAHNGNVLIEEYENTKIDDKFKKFTLFITIGTYQKFMLRTIATVVNDPTKTWGEVFEVYPDIGSINDTFSQIINEDKSKQTEFLKSIYKYWEDDLINL